jgi:hypothetical protein
MLDPLVHLKKVLEEMVGTPFHHQGRLPGQALDCGGVLICLLKALGLPHKVSEDYPLLPRISRPHLMPAIQDLVDLGALRLRETPCQEPLSLGEVVVFFILKNRRLPQHLGVVSSISEAGPVITHSHTGIGRCVEERVTPFWRNRISSVFQIVGVSD